MIGSKRLMAEGGLSKKSRIVAMAIFLVMALCVCQPKVQVKLVKSNNICNKPRLEYNFKPIKNRFLNFAATNTNFVSIAQSDMNMPIHIKLNTDDASGPITIIAPVSMFGNDINNNWQVDRDDLILTLPTPFRYYFEKFPAQFSFIVLCNNISQILCIEIVNDFEVRSKSGDMFTNMTNAGNQTVISKEFSLRNNRKSTLVLDVTNSGKTIGTFTLEPLSTQIVSIELAKGSDISIEKETELVFTADDMMECTGKIQNQSFTLVSKFDDNLWDINFSKTGTKRIQFEELVDSSDLKLIARNNSKSLSINIVLESMDGQQLSYWYRFDEKLGCDQKKEFSFKIYPDLTAGEYAFTFSASGIKKVLTISVGKQKNTLSLQIGHIDRYQSSFAIADATDNKIWCVVYDLYKHSHDKTVVSTIFHDVKTGSKKIFASEQIVGVSKDFVATVRVTGKDNNSGPTTEEVMVYRKRDAKLLYRFNADYTTPFRDCLYNFWLVQTEDCLLFCKTQLNESPLGHESKVFAYLDMKLEKMIFGSKEHTFGMFSFENLFNNRKVTYQPNRNSGNVKMSVDPSGLETDSCKNSQSFSVIDQFGSSYAIGFVDCPFEDSINGFDGIICVGKNGKQLWSKRTAFGLSNSRLFHKSWLINEKYFMLCKDMILLYGSANGKLLSKFRIEEVFGDLKGKLSINSVASCGEDIYMTVEQESDDLRVTDIYKVRIKQP